MAGHLTLALIKPHICFQRKVGPIITRIEKESFGILLAKNLQLLPEGAEEFYSEHQGKDFFPNLVTTMCSGPIWVLVLSKHAAVESWRQVIGNTNSAKAEPGTIRFEFGDHNNITNNAVHGSSDDWAAKREINFFFSREIQLASRVEELKGP